MMSAQDCPKTAKSSSPIPFIAHFQKEWQTGARMSSRSIMGSFGGAFALTFARAKTFSLTQVLFWISNEQKFKCCMTLKRMKILKQKG